MSRYQLMRAAVSRLAATATEQQAYLEELLHPLAVDGDSSGYGNDELALQFEDYFSVESETRGGVLREQQFEALKALWDFLISLSGGRNPEFWYREALHSDDRWEEVRNLAKAALELLPTENSED